MGSEDAGGRCREGDVLVEQLWPLLPAASGGLPGVYIFGTHLVWGAGDFFPR